MNQTSYNQSGISHKENNMSTIVLEYDAKMDSKKRLTIRGAKFDYYNIKEMDDGSIVISPRVLVDPFEISEDTLSMIDSSVKNMKKGKVSKPIKL